METKEVVTTEKVAEKVTKKVNVKKIAGIAGAIGTLIAIGGGIAYHFASKSGRDDEDEIDDEDLEDYTDETDEEEDNEVEVEQAD